MRAIEREVLRSKWWIAVIGRDCILLSPARFSDPLRLQQFSLVLGPNSKRPITHRCAFSLNHTFVVLSFSVSMKVIVEVIILSFPDRNFSTAFVK